MIPILITAYIHLRMNIIKYYKLFVFWSENRQEESSDSNVEESDVKDAEVFNILEIDQESNDENSPQNSIYEIEKLENGLMSKIKSIFERRRKLEMIK